MRYYEASAGDISSLRIRVFSRRFKNFKKIHQGRIKFEADIAGAKLQ